MTHCICAAGTVTALQHQFICKKNYRKCTKDSETRIVGGLLTVVSRNEVTETDGDESDGAEIHRFPVCPTFDAIEYCARNENEETSANCTYQQQPVDSATPEELLSGGCGHARRRPSVLAPIHVIVALRTQPRQHVDERLRAEVEQPAKTDDWQHEERDSEESEDHRKYSTFHCLRSCFRVTCQSPTASPHPNWIVHTTGVYSGVVRAFKPSPLNLMYVYKDTLPALSLPIKSLENCKKALQLFII